MRLLVFLQTHLYWLVDIYKSMGWEVAVIPYFPNEVFQKQVSSNGVVAGPVREKGFWMIEENTEYQKEIKQFIRSFKPDLAWSELLFPPGYGLLLAREMGIPTISSSYGQDVCVVPSVRYGFWYDSRKRNMINQVVRKGIDAYACTPWCIRMLQQRWSPPRRVRMYEAVLHKRTPRALGRSREVVRQELGLDSNTPLFLFWGRWISVKGITTILEAFSRLPKGVARLGLVGRRDREYDDRMSQLIDRHSNRKDILTFDWADVQRVQELVRAADVAIVASLSEQGPGSGVMAAEFGVPIIATGVGYFSSLRSWTPRPFRLIRRGSSDSLAREMQFFLDPEKRDEYAKRSRSIRRMFEEDAIRASWEKIFADVLTHSRTRTKRRAHIDRISV